MSAMIFGVREYLLTPEAAAAMDAPGSTDAAVLVPLFPDPLTAVFTERRADLRRHAGEISFPGGRQDEPGEDLRLTALREAKE
jgi:8-oxo-dGTP pyrophosphatase MutT (NUDIX family)